MSAPALPVAHPRHPSLATVIGAAALAIALVALALALPSARTAKVLPAADAASQFEQRACWRV